MIGTLRICLAPACCFVVSALTMVALFLAAFLVARLASAAPPEHVDPALSGWFQSLQRPDIGSCCSVADGRVTESRVVGDHYEVLIDSRFPGVTEPSWQPVPAAAILKRVDNPTGGTVAFWYMGQVRCVVLPAEI